MPSDAAAPGSRHLLGGRRRPARPGFFHPVLPAPGDPRLPGSGRVDQTIFQTYTDLDLSGYQGYDKALDVYYLAIAYLSTLRNWTNRDAFQVAWFLFYYRLVGVVLFELCIGGRCCSSSRTRSSTSSSCTRHAAALGPSQLSRRTLILLAAVIWIFIKLPQEYWIHIAKLDTTDLITAHPWIGRRGRGRPRRRPRHRSPKVVPAWGPPPDSWRVAADPLPADIDDVPNSDAWIARHRRVLERKPSRRPSSSAWSA